MIKLSHGDLRSYDYDFEKNDYFYRDNGERVPNNKRTGFHTSVFLQSSKHSLDKETEKLIEERHIQYEDFKARMKAKYTSK